MPGKRILPLILVMAVLCARPALGGALMDEHGRLFTAYFSAKIQAASILPVLTGDEEDLRSGRVPNLTLCVEKAAVEGVVYETLLIVLEDVFFSTDARGIHVHSFKTARVTGTLGKKDFLQSLNRNMPHFAVSELDLKDGTVTVKGVYEKKLMFKVRALMRFTGKYVVEKSGAAKIRFDESSNDNAMVSARDVGRAVANASPAINFQKFFVRPAVEEVRVDHDMVWFSAR